MARSVIFTVPLDPGDEMRVESRDARERADSRWRAEIVTHARSRAVRGALVAALLVPLAAGTASLAFAEGLWAGLVSLLAASATVAIGAAVAGAVGSNTRGGVARAAERLAAAGLSGAAVGIATAPAVVWAAASGDWNEAQVVPAIAVLMVVGVGCAWLGAAAAAVRAWGRPALAGAAAGALLVAAPLALFASLVPSTTTEDEIEVLAFHAAYADHSGVAVPAYFCETETAYATRTHTEAVAWIALASPLAWAVDAPSWTPAQLVAARDSVSTAQAWLRSTQIGPDDVAGHCFQATSLGVPTGVKEERMSRAHPVGATTALAFAGLAGLVAWATVSRRTRS